MDAVYGPSRYVCRGISTVVYLPEIVIDTFEARSELFFDAVL